MSAWEPQPHDLAQLVQLLQTSVNPDQEVQDRLRQQLESYNAIADFNNYLAYIFAALGDDQTTARTVAGLALKNNLKQHYHALSPTTIAYVKDAVLRALVDPSNTIRSTAGTVISAIYNDNPANWPEIVPKLMELMEHAEPKVVQSASDALKKVCEDTARQLDSQQGLDLSVLIGKLIAHFRNPNPVVRVNVLVALNQFLFIRSNALMLQLPTFVEHLYSLTVDADAAVRKTVCQSMVLLLESCPDALLPQVDNVIKFMLFCTKDEDPSVALEACEFWLALVDVERLRPHIAPYFADLMPLLLSRMVYTEDDLLGLGADYEDDANVPDKEQDIKPRFHRVKTHKTELNAGGRADAAAQEGGANDGDGDDDDASDFDDEDDDDEDGLAGEWNVRKCSAAALDILSTFFHDEILPHLLPSLNACLTSTEWERRESGILALGAIAEGCMVGITPHLPLLIPMLRDCLHDPKPLLRNITCWTLGRYASWIVDPPNKDPSAVAQHHAQYFRPVLEAILTSVLDNNKRVQEAACSALATIEEAAGALLVPYLDHLTQVIGAAFTKYQSKNILILYDAVGTLADCVGAALNHPVYISRILPPIMQNWSVMTDDRSDTIALMECLASVAMAVGSGFHEAAPVVWQRCLTSLQNALQAIVNFAETPDQLYDFPESEFMVVALDLMSGVVQGLTEDVQPLVASNDHAILRMLHVLLKDARAEVQQSSYALLGDFAIFAYPQLKPFLPQIMPELMTRIDPNMDAMYQSVCINAIWAVGEIALQTGAEMAHWAPPLLERLIAILCGPPMTRTLLENVAITIGRLGVVVPELIAPHLETFGQPWCKHTRALLDNAEKETAFLGMCRMIQTNPSGMFRHFSFFCDAVALWQTPSPELATEFAQIFKGFREMLGDQWTAFIETLPQDVREKLRPYGV